jgi:uncharacterized membrane protein
MKVSNLVKIAIILLVVGLFVYWDQDQASWASTNQETERQTVPTATPPPEPATPTAPPPPPTATPAPVAPTVTSTPTLTPTVPALTETPSTLPTAGGGSWFLGGVLLLLYGALLLLGGLRARPRQG